MNPATLVLFVSAITLAACLGYQRGRLRGMQEELARVSGFILRMDRRLNSPAAGSASAAPAQTGAAESFPAAGDFSPKRTA